MLKSSSYISKLIAVDIVKKNLMKFNEIETIQLVLCKFTLTLIVAEQSGFMCIKLVRKKSNKFHKSDGLSLLCANRRQSL